MKKYYKYILFCFLICFLGEGVFCFRSFNSGDCFAYEDQSEIETLLQEEVFAQLESLDFSYVDELVQSVGTFESVEFYQLVKNLINGESAFDVEMVLGLLKSLFFENFSLYISLFLSIIAICFLSSISGELFSKKTFSVSSSISTIFYVSVAVIVCALTSVVLSEVIEKIVFISKFVEVVFPILLTCLVALGANNTAILLQPSVLYLVSFFVSIVSKFLVPLIVVGVVIKIVGNLSDSFRLDKFLSFVNSLFKWVLGLVFTIFIGILSLKGLTTSSMDNISIKTAKYAIRSYIPLIGGYLSDGFEIFRAGSLLIKNAIGVVAIFLLFITLLGVLVKIIFLNLAFKLASGIAEPLGSSKISKFLSSISSSFVQMIVVLLSCFFAVFILILIVLTAGNCIS